MELRIDPLTLSKRVSGWAFVGLLALGFAGLYLLNYLMPLSGGSYTSRVWDWAELSFAAGALAVLAFTWRSLDLRTALLGAALALVSGLSRAFSNSSPLDGAAEGIAVWLTFCAGAALFRRLKARAVTAFQPPPASILRGLGMGVLFALPLAALNNLFFYFQNGAPPSKPSPRRPGSRPKRSTPCSAASRRSCAPWWTLPSPAMRSQSLCWSGLSSS